jgi:hypothetical protein
LSVKYGPERIPADWRDPASASRYRTYFSPASFVLALDEALEQAGVEMWYDTLSCAPVVEAGRVTGLEVENKSGRRRLAGTVVIDATGDADVARRAGAPCVEGDNMLSNWALETSLGAAEEAVRRRDGYGLLQVNKFNRDRAFCWGVSGRKVTEFVLASRRQLRAHYAGRQREEGKDAVYPLALATQANVRKTVGIVGRSSLRVGDAWMPRPDGVGVLTHSTAGGGAQLPVWEIPYGALLPRGVDGLLVAGRAIGAEDEAWELLRPIPPCVSTGQIAGAAAALAAKRNCRPHEIDLDQLRCGLRAAGAKCGLEELYGRLWRDRVPCR